MGIIEKVFGGSAKEKPPMTIQSLESLLTKRRGKMGHITLLIEGESYRLVPLDDYERIMRSVRAVEAMHGVMTDERLP